MSTNRDLLLVAHEFTAKVVATLNAAGLKPADEDMVCAVLVVVCPDQSVRHEDPLHASLNYDRKTGQWFDAEMGMSERVAS